ncbi:MAG: RNA polymerase sigma-70 factor [Bacteroidia bacterium]|nr:RNA polymerase sigma-70 factor [Bacteroidia bacterium]
MAPEKLQSIETLFRQHYAALHWFCFQYVKSKEDADEIVNDTFLALWERDEPIDPNRNIKPLLYTIVRNKSLNLLKKKKIEIADVEAGFEVISDVVSPIELIQAKETEALVNKAIEALPPKCQRIFIMSRKEQLSNKEIAAILDITEKTVENQITIAIRNIRASLNKGRDNGLPLVIFPWILAMLLEA